MNMDNTMQDRSNICYEYNNKDLDLRGILTKRRVSSHADLGIAS